MLFVEAKKNFIWNIAFYAIVLALIAGTYKYILPILTPFIIGFCVASIIRLPLRKLHLKNPKHAKLVSGLLCVVFYIVIMGLLVLIGSWIFSEVRGLVVALPDLMQSWLIPFAQETAESARMLLDPIDPDLTQWILDLSNNITQSLGQYATNLSASAVKWLANSAISLPGLLVQIILAVVSTFYFAADYPLVLDFLKKLIPEGKRGMIVHAVCYARTAVLAFLKSYSIMFVITFVELCIGFSIMRIPYAVAIAFAIAVFDLMPVLGVGGILLPWSAVLVVLGNYPLAIGVAVLYIVIAAVRNALEPKIVGERIGLHPLATLIAMMLGLKLMGVLGMLFFPICLVAAVNFRKSTQQPTEAESGTL